MSLNCSRVELHRLTGIGGVGVNYNVPVIDELLEFLDTRFNLRLDHVRRCILMWVWYKGGQQTNVDLSSSQKDMTLVW